MKLTIEVVGIRWDTEVDGEIQKVDLDENMTVEIDFSGDHNQIGKDSQTDFLLDEAIADKLSDTTGWCVFGWDHIQIK